MTDNMLDVTDDRLADLFGDILAQASVFWVPEEKRWVQLRPGAASARTVTEDEVTMRSRQFLKGRHQQMIEFSLQWHFPARRVIEKKAEGLRKGVLVGRLVRLAKADVRILLTEQRLAARIAAGQVAA